MIAYYAHSHGNGHANYAEQFAKQFKNEAVVLTSSDYTFDSEIIVIHLSSEDTCYTSYKETVHNLPKYAHYLPKSVLNIAQRAHQITTAIVRYSITFSFIDVSVETAALFRLAGIPYAYCRMIGNRNDQPHAIAYDAAEFLFAYYPKRLESPTTLSWIVEKTHYIGFISRFPPLVSYSNYQKSSDENLNVTVIIGSGGTLCTNEILLALAEISKINNIAILSSDIFEVSHPKITCLGFVSNFEDLIHKSDVVINSCGMNLTSEILALKGKLLVFPEKRPYDEQLHLCENLVRQKLAVVFDSTAMATSIQNYLDLPIRPDIHDFFGCMEKLKAIKFIKKYSYETA